ncbi:hypothetical protein SLEP1_g41730 [Rubroshorea leprosula]|uniref:Uncharacterized protein n=1 Tax=Rubroshorea leprosula TaxID=152421 RepID=A0AAV5L7W0_9ROSI|nr:hypothetical protein SLEP1_g41730 [Rubroshorea leprosula]
MFRALCICGTSLTSARRLPRPRIWVLGRDRITPQIDAFVGVPIIFVFILLSP